MKRIGIGVALGATFATLVVGAAGSAPPRASRSRPKMSLASNKVYEAASGYPTAAQIQHATAFCFLAREFKPSSPPRPVLYIARCGAGFGRPESADCTTRVARWQAVMPQVLLRKAVPSDLEQLACLRTALWPDSPIEEHQEELESILAGNAPGILPLVELVAEARDGALVGFAEVGLRSCADSCDLKQPVGYLEGWFVVENYRRQGIGARLLTAAEEWAHAQGCIEMASDAEINNITSQHVHAALGFEVTGRSVNYRKKL